MRLMAQAMAKTMPAQVIFAVDQLHAGVREFGRGVGIDTQSEEFLLSIEVIAQFIHTMGLDEKLPLSVSRKQFVDYMTTSLGLLGGWTYARSTMGNATDTDQG